MNVGMLWLDDDKQTSFEDKVLRAADYYREKYGRAPNLCLVNKTMVEDEQRVGKIQVQPVKNVLPNHFWIGVSAG
ncbi:MAG: hypothetical protein JSW55_02330 [Chloroflexota bacterium]|nr:MAG: hypothetical protein JSW55_02330 [Chloroflexota bacterium]